MTPKEAAAMAPPPADREDEEDALAGMTPTERVEVEAMLDKAQTRRAAGEPGIPAEEVIAKWAARGVLPA